MYLSCLNFYRVISHSFPSFLALGSTKFSVSAEPLQSSELCGNEVAEVPEIGRKDTVVKTLLAEVSQSNHLTYYPEFLAKVTT